MSCAGKSLQNWDGEIALGNWFGAGRERTTFFSLKNEEEIGFEVPKHYNGVCPD